MKCGFILNKGYCLKFFFFFIPVSFASPVLAADTAVYSQEVLKNAFVDAVKEMHHNNPLQFSDASPSDINDIADVFSRRVSMFDSPLKQNYELHPWNMAISSLIGDLSKKTVPVAAFDSDNLNYTDNFLLYKITTSDYSMYTNINKLVTEIIAHLPPLVVQPYKEPGISTDVNVSLNAGKSWHEVTRNWDKNAATWKTPEAMTNWGLNRMNAYYAYALGITGEGVNIGILDSGILSQHPEFQGKNAQGERRVQTVITDGVFYASHPHYLSTVNPETGTPDGSIPKKNGEYVKGERFHLSGEFDPAINDEHGTWMSGVLAARRDGNGIQGVAFNANLFMANTGGTDDDRFNGSEDLDYNLFKASFDALAAKNVILVNESWGNKSRDEVENNVGNVRNDAAENLSALRRAYRSFWDKLQGGHKTWMDAMLDAGREYHYVQVTGSGNGSEDANPILRGDMPFFYPDVESRWLVVTGFDESGAQVYSQCGVAKWWCIMGVTGMPSTHVLGGYVPNSNGTSTSTPNISGAMALIAQRFPWMTPEQVREVLLTTSTLQLQDDPSLVVGNTIGVRTYGTLLPVHDAPAGTPQVPNVNGWGLPDLKKAMQGPGQFLGRMVAEIPGGTRDIWANNISDEALRARQQEDEAEQTEWENTKQKRGWQNGLPVSASSDDRYEYETGHNREISAHNFAGDPLTDQTYVGSLTKLGDGELVLSGDNSYHGSTWVRGGKLTVDGSLLNSTVTVDGSGTGYINPVTHRITTTGGILSGAGILQDVTINAGGTVAPGHSSGTLNVRDISFNPGAIYQTEVKTNGENNRIHGSGKIMLNGGDVTVLLERRPNMLSADRVAGFTGQQYTILSADQGISGRFSGTDARHLFLKASLQYQPASVTMRIDRNGTTFASVAATPNEHAVAAAADNLVTGNPVYESLLDSTTAGEARRAFRQLSGQIHADIASTQINDSRYLRDAMNNRLVRAGGRYIDADNGVWVQLPGIWSHASDNTAGYRASTHGVLLGLDKACTESCQLGIITGYTRTSLYGNSGSKAGSDNYHLGVYGSRRWNDLSLRAGGSYTWHRFESSRQVKYGTQSDYEMARYGAHTRQVFAEVGYDRHTGGVNLEPFAGLSYVNFSNDGINENGGAAALHGDKQHTDVTQSMLGLRTDKTWKISKKTVVMLRGELGWQYQYGNLSRDIGLRFVSGDTAFLVKSVPASRDGAVVKTNVEMALNKNAVLSLGYSGLLSQHYQDNSMNVGFRWRF